MRRNPLVVAGAALAVVALPVIAIAIATTSHGGSPSDIYSTTEPEICAEVDVGGTSAMPTPITVDGTSHLLVSFSAERSGIRGDDELLLTFDIFDSSGGFVEGTPFEWGFGRTFETHESGTVEWTFDNVAAGTYTVQVGARIDPAPPGPAGSGDPVAALENCALTVSVSPVA
jgi:hypothetical protein